jgi:hypothetical protein
MRATSTFHRHLVSAAIAAVLAAVLGLAGCGSSGNTVTSPSSVSKCSVAFDAPASTVPATGGAGAITIKTARECQWTAQPEVNWLTITAGGSGQGDGSVQFNAASNSDPVGRTGGVMVNGLRAQITQAAGECRFDLGSSSASFGQTGGSGTADLRASSPLCTWTATSDAEWISITSNASGKGTAAVSFSVAPTTGAPRTGTLTIAGLHFNITQSEGCTYTVAPLSYSAGSAGGSQAVTVASGAGCPWTASSNADWITVAPATGTGAGTVTLNVAPTSGPSRTGTVTIAGSAVTVSQSPGCTFDVSPLSHNVDASGGTRTVNVTGGAGCAWAASSAQPWITITSGTSGSGSGTVTFSVAAATGPSRSGTLIVAGQTVTVTQGNGCSFAIAPDTQSVPASGGNGNVSVTAGTGCAWTAKSNVSWITVTSGASGSGNGTVSLTISGTNGPGRSGTVTIAGRTFTVNQGQGCSFSLSSTSASLAPSGGSGTFDVRSAAGCGWSAASSASWLTVAAGSSGSGNGTVGFTAGPNTGPERTATITAGGQTFTVTQGAGCSYSLVPPSQTVPSGGGPGSFSVTTTAGCAWTAQADAAWLSITSGASGTGPGTVQFTAAPNTGSSRSGTITAAGQTFTVNQESGCSAVVAPDTIAEPAAGGSQNVSVTTAADCPWSATSNAAWITIAVPAAGTGNGNAQLDIQANSGAARSGTATVAGHTATVNQDSGCSVSIEPAGQAVPVGGGPGSITVTAPAGCPWTAVSNSPEWLTITGPASGSGSGTVQFAVAANATGAARTGLITIGNQTFTVTQAGTQDFPLPR